LALIARIFIAKATGASSSRAPAFFEASPLKNGSSNPDSRPVYFGILSRLNRILCASKPELGGASSIRGKLIFGHPNANAPLLGGTRHPFLGRQLPLSL
jgi:hypothetical protein